MPKKPSQKSNHSQPPIPNDLDRHLCWLFVACKLGKRNEDTVIFLDMLKTACELAIEQITKEFPDPKDPIPNTIPYISGHLAAMLNIHQGN